MASYDGIAGLLLQSGGPAPMVTIRNLIRRPLVRLGVAPRRTDLEPEFLELYERCRPYTMTTVERMYGVYQAVRYVVTRDIPGDIVECGVWRGGSSMLSALTLERLGASGRAVYLYDTFAGMAEPTEADGRVAQEKWAEHQRHDINEWCYSPLEEVQANMTSTGLPPQFSVLVKGRVEETIPATVPDRIAILRLDTDWYESTRHELEHLYPLLSDRGVLIVDDYGHWSGARKAIDEYFADTVEPILLNRLDYTGRIAIKA